MSSGNVLKPIRILIVDDHPILREGMSAVIQGQRDMVLVGEASNGREAVELFREQRPDVTLMDLRMPEMDGVAATLAIRAECSDACIVMLTTYRGDAQALRALKAGASGYLLEEHDPHGFDRSHPLGTRGPSSHSARDRRRIGRACHR